MSESLPATRRSTLALLPAIIDEPVATMAQVASFARWRWLLPITMMLIGLAVSIALSGPLQVKEAVTQMNVQLQSQLSQVPAEQAAAARAQVERFTQPVFILGAGAAGKIVSVVLAWLLAAAILYFAGLIAGADLNFGRMFATIPWAWLPFALRDMAQGVFTAMTGSLLVNQGLSPLVAQATARANMASPVYQLLAHVDLFTAWHLVLIYAALRGGAALERSKAFWLTVIYAILSLALRIIPGLVTGALLPG